MTPIRIVVALLGTVALSACGGLPFSESSSPIGGGPLSASVDEAGGGFYARRLRNYPNYSVTFGFPLCLANGREPAVLNAVEGRGTDAAPLTVFLRTVTPEVVAAAPPRERPRYAGAIAARGRPPAFDEPYVEKDLRVTGSYSTRVRGTHITQTCEESDAALLAVNRRQVPQSSSTDLMIAISAGVEGAEVNGLVIDYTVAGKLYRRTVPWDMVVCDAAGRRHNCDKAGP